MWNYRGRGRPDFAEEPAPGQESVWDYPRPPVLVADDAAAAELAEGGGAVAVAPRADAIAATLDEWLDDEGGRAALGDRARAVAKERYHPRAMVDAYEMLYDRVIGARGAA